MTEFERLNVVGSARSILRQMDCGVHTYWGEDDEGDPNCARNAMESVRSVVTEAIVKDLVRDCETMKYDDREQELRGILHSIRTLCEYMGRLKLTGDERKAFENLKAAEAAVADEYDDEFGE